MEKDPENGRTTRRCGYLDRDLDLARGRAGSISRAIENATRVRQAREAK